MVAITRRQGLAALVAGGAAAAWFGWGVAADEGALIRRIIERSVGPFTMNPSQFDEFLYDFHDTYGGQNRIKVAAFRMLSAAGGSGARLVPVEVQDRHAGFERKVVTHFLTRTDYLKSDETAREVSFVPDIGCSSPFARFEPV